MASGRGYGLVINERGDTLEFIGTAHKGLAAGSGGMIIQRSNQIGAIYYEGEFSQGLPDGVVRIEQAGFAPRLRTFKAGVDMGKASAANLQSLDFAQVTTKTTQVMP
jgi:hypothetical protein